MIAAWLERAKCNRIKRQLPRSIGGKENSVEGIVRTL